MERYKDLFSYIYKKDAKLKPSPFLPMSTNEMDKLGWDSCDIIIVTGDAYVDHPSFGMAIIGRLLEQQGFRVGIIAQPDWKNKDEFMKLGAPKLMFGITSGNMDSMVNHYTADQRIRTNDAYTPDGISGKRPDRAVIVYSQRCREAYSGIPLIIGGVEASLRRVAHYDYWSDKVRRSILLDSKADILVYGNGERQIVEIAHQLKQGVQVKQITDIQGTAIALRAESLPYLNSKQISSDKSCIENNKKEEKLHKAKRLPSFEQIKDDPIKFAYATNAMLFNENDKVPVVQEHSQRDVWINPVTVPLTTKELDMVYELPFARKPHPLYKNSKIPAYEMIRFSVTITRGCFGGCAFCSIVSHEGRVVQSRSEASILQEIERVKEKTPGFTGIISDLGGPTANMYSIQCKQINSEKSCTKPSCLYPHICKNLQTDHAQLISLYRKARGLEGIKKVLIGSGVRYDLAVKSPDYIKELATHHVGGYLKIAPEHICKGPLQAMHKPGMDSYLQFKSMFFKYSEEAGKKQYLIPYFIAAHPGTSTNDMLELALWLKQNDFRLDQVQTFLPSPMTIATTMYHSGKNPYISGDLSECEEMIIPKGLRIRRIHKAFLRYHDSANWDLLRKVLKDLNREDLIGNSADHLIPPESTAKNVNFDKKRTRRKDKKRYN